MSGSAVAIYKVTHIGTEAPFGLKAHQDILFRSYIKETCSLMLLDQVSKQGPLIIKAISSQILPSVPRLILGPFQFINYDCNPNSHMSDNNSIYILWSN